MSEVTKGRVELTTEVDDEEAFTMFIQYLYYGDYQVDKLAKQDHDDSCASGSSTETTTTGNNKQSSNAHLLLHAKVYVLAERLCVISLKELSCIKLTEGLCWVLLDKRMADCPLESFCAIINTIYAHTTLTRSAKKVRELLADFASRRLSVERRRPNFLDCVARYPDFAVDLVRMAGDHRPSKKK